MAHIEFKGKTFVRNHHLVVKYHELIPVKTKGLSSNPSLEDNLIVHGDNLKALKALLPMYSGRVKCVYIDPPYNTGNEKWAYNDNVTSPMMQDWLGKVVDREDLTRHDKWLCMMMPRLMLLRELLTDDGVILVSIDDNEAHHLRGLMDEVFGEENFLAQLVWEKGRKNDAKFFSVGHEYMVVYCKSMDTLVGQKTIWREGKPGAKELWGAYVELKAKHGDDVGQIESELRDWIKELPARHAAKKLTRYCHIDQWGPWRDRDISWPGGGGPRYDVVHPVTGKPCKVPDCGWRFSAPEEMQRQIDDGLIVFREDHTEPPIRKAHLRPIPEELSDSDDYDEDDENGVGMQVMPSVIYKQSQSTVKFFKKLMGDVDFKNPKDYEVIGRILDYVTGSDPNCTILDSFAGTGTTAHAVSMLNHLDGGNRRFILIECEEYADSITAERVRRVIEGVPKAKDKTLRKGLGGSFSFFKLGKPIEAQGMLDGTALPSYDDLARYVYYTATGEEFDPSATDRKTGLIGKSTQHDVYLFYEPDMDKLRDMAFTLDMARALPKLKKGRRRLVFAPTKYMGQEHLDRFRTDFAQLPFEIYERVR